MTPSALEAEISYLQTAQISEVLRNRLTALHLPFRANSNISAALLPGELEALETEVTARVRDLLAALVIDVENDHNTNDTARRVAKMFVREVFAGRYQPPPQATDFPNIMQVDECYAVGPIAIRSACAHHLVPIEGNAWIGVIPRDRLIGLSKFHRLTDWIMSRPQIQEEAAQQLADKIEFVTDAPRALGIVIRARHLCCSWRGVRDGGSMMTTSVMRGLFKTDDKARAELLALIRGMGF